MGRRCCPARDRQAGWDMSHPMASGARDVPRGTPRMGRTSGSAAYSLVFTGVVRWFNSPLAHSSEAPGYGALSASGRPFVSCHVPPSATPTRVRRSGAAIPHVPIPCRVAPWLVSLLARQPSRATGEMGWRRPSFPCRQTWIPLVSAYGTRAHAENRKHGRRVGMRQFGYCLGEGGAWRGAVARAAECESSLRPDWATPINARRDDHGECRSPAAVPSRGRPRSPIRAPVQDAFGSSRGDILHVRVRPVPVRIARRGGATGTAACRIRGQVCRWIWLIWSGRIGTWRSRR
jgi:hypothetical protein